VTFAPDPGTVLGGKYRILRALGSGGMGTVFEAENLRTHKRVAVKWLLPNLARREEASVRLVREAQAAARVRHHNVVDVYDVEVEGDAVFLVMEYLEGEPLTAVFRRRDLRMDQLIALLLPAMRGVAAAHRQGIVHRDIKPDNIFLAREDGALEPVPKVLDFGIAKLIRGDEEQPSITASGIAVGTPRYMSFEQLTGVKDIDVRADVYAFGVMLYEALTGRPPYEAETLSEHCFKMATQPARPPKSLRADIPTRLSDLVLRAMAKARSDRTPSVDALIRELEPFANEGSFLGSMTAPGTSVPPMAAAPGRQPAALHAAETTVVSERTHDGMPQAPTASRFAQPVRVPRRSRARLAAVALGFSVVAGGLAAFATREARDPARVERPLPSDAAQPATRSQPPVAAPSPGAAIEPVPTSADAQVSELTQDASAPSPSSPERARLRGGGEARASSSEPRSAGQRQRQGSRSEPAPATSSSKSSFRVNKRPSADEF
jgi:eukaryotic-like serine/threonine-protein kinase